MKKTTLFVISVISYLSALASCLWAIVEFILYLAKDRPFNWWSVACIVICVAVTVIVIVISSYREFKERKALIDFLKNKTKSEPFVKQRPEFPKDR